MAKKDTLAPSAQIGKQLIREALHDVNEQQKKKIVKQVSDIMERLSLMKRVALKTSLRIEFLEKQLDAINKGQFEIVDKSLAGVPGQQVHENEIKFQDDELNVDWSETEKWG